MAKRQKSLFGNELPGPEDTAGLVAIYRPGQPLTNEQRAFNRLIARVEALQEKLERETGRLNAALAFHAEHVHPRLRRLGDLAKELILALARFLDDKRLKRGERSKLRVLLEERLMEVDDLSNDKDLQAVFKKVYGVDFKKAQEEEIEQIRSEIGEMFEDIGIEIDLSDLRPDMNPEEAAAKAAEIGEKLRQKDEEFERAFPPPKRRKTKRQLEREALLEQAEQLRQKSLSSIYKQLAKAIHPDLEPDAARRQEKSAVMQELTEAYRNNDLHKLLRLELQWIHKEEGNLDRLSEEKLAVYNQLLKEQIHELEREIAELPSHPRYRPLAASSGPFRVRLRTHGPAEARWMDQTIERMEASIARLRGDDPLDSVRALINTYRLVR